jgi:nitrogen fixation protein NifQ
MLYAGETAEPRPLRSARRDEPANEAIATYIALTGGHPAAAWIESDVEFDRHVLACVLSVGAESATPEERTGLAHEDLAGLIARRFPHMRRLASPARVAVDHGEADERAMLRDLLLANRSTPGPESGWLATIIARRAMEPNHLWEDLGLRNRGELSRLLERHFKPLALRNTKNMRWKRFFYRTLCEDDGLVMCSTPVCSCCGDFDLCFGEETGESGLAHARRRLALKAAAS